MAEAIRQKTQERSGLCFFTRVGDGPSFVQLSLNFHDTTVTTHYIIFLRYEDDLVSLIWKPRVITEV